MNKDRTSIRSRIRDLVALIKPYDQREQADIIDILGWIDSGAELFRRVKPDVPSRHLVSYFVLVDNARRSLLLVDHVKAGLWLPTGGHVEQDEDPRETVKREMAEELGPKAAQVSTVADLPLFVTSGLTRGASSHTDVSLWYVVAGDERMWLDVDSREFRGHKWQTFESVLATDVKELDPNMHRFVGKLQARM